MSGRMTGERRRAFPPAPTVMIETGVTSEPVPAVVGTRQSGRRGPLALPTPQASSSASIEPQQQCRQLGDVERGAAAEADDAGCAARAAGRHRALSVAREGSASTASKTVSESPAASSEAIAGSPAPAGAARDR